MMPRASALRSPASRRSARDACFSVGSVPASTAAYHASPVSRRRPGIVSAFGFWWRNGMVTPKYGRLLARLAWRRFLTPAGRRMQLDGVVFLGGQVRLEIGRRARVRFGRWTWIGDGT